MPAVGAAFGVAVRAGLLAGIVGMHIRPEYSQSTYSVTLTLAVVVTARVLARTRAASTEGTNAPPPPDPPRRDS